MEVGVYGGLLWLGLLLLLRLWLLMLLLLAEVVPRVRFDLQPTPISFPFPFLSLPLPLALSHPNIRIKFQIKPLIHLIKISLILMDEPFLQLIDHSNDIIDLFYCPVDVFMLFLGCGAEQDALVVDLGE